MMSPFTGKGEESCADNYDLIGCYEEYDPGVILLNDRHNIEWKDISSYMKRYAV